MLPRTPYVVIPVLLLVAVVGEPPVNVLLAFLAGVVLPVLGRGDHSSGGGGGRREIDR